MQLWMDDKAQVIVATNALEWALTKQMSTVIHILPENIENYYQEGRSGRNGEKAFAVLLTNPSDIAENQFIHILPDKKFLNETNKLCNFFKLLMEKGSTKDSLTSEFIFCFKI
jgi:ATP-dependent DNA helicase RecQ